MFPSVTSILARYSGIDDLKSRFPQVIEQAAVRGTAVHAWCEAQAAHLFPPALPEKWQGYAASFCQWFSGVEEVVALERRIFDYRLKFHGQFDIVCRLKGDRHYSLWDYKTSETQNKTWPLQIAAYRHLARIEGIETVRGGMIRLRKSGKPPLVNEYTATAKKDWNLFVSALNIHLNFYM